ncbi:MAG: hypothetical protein HOY71_05095 [Nonomuraea sp.]|nr:hypothetical protein [Nonomuraea sp.]
MSKDVQQLSDTDIHVYEALAGGATDLPALVRATALPEQDVRQSLATLIAQGHVLPSGDGFELGPHDFEVDY